MHSYPISQQAHATWLRWLISLALLLGMAGTAAAATLQGTVVGLSDGDTITVLDASKTQYRVRLAGIDAPEKRQAFGDRSRQSLADLVFRKQVTVEYSKTYRYGRLIGKVLVGDLDACLEQVQRGLAWHYKAYELEQAPNDRWSYAQAERYARRERKGLWQDNVVVPPWDFRRHRFIH